MRGLVRAILVGFSASRIWEDGGCGQEEGLKFSSSLFYQGLDRWIRTLSHGTKSFKSALCFIDIKDLESLLMMKMMSMK